MQELIEKVKVLEKGEINKVVSQRLSEFSSFKNKNDNEWFSELCFCILTANAKQKTGAKIQSILGPEGFLSKKEEELVGIIRENKHRFHNNKAKYIAQARQFANIKTLLQEKSEIEARNFLVQNIKGLGMKEASHFLRNTGSQNLSILDRHILNVLSEHKIIERPKSLNHKSYIEIEKKFNELAKELRMSPAKLDLFMWYMKTGEVLK